MNRRWLIASFATAAVAVGVFGGTVLAQEAEDDGETGSKSIFARAAEILGVEEQALKDAFEQAGHDMADERRDAHLDSLVEAGVLTEEEAADIREWLDVRPEPLDNLPGPHGHGFVPRGPGGPFGRAFGPRHEFVIPKIEGMLPPDGAFFERFNEVRRERGFGRLDGRGFHFHWSGPADDDAGDEGGETVTGEGVSL